MSTVWKVMIGLLVTLPVAAFFTGSMLASSGADLPDQRIPIVVSDRDASPSPDAGQDPDGRKNDDGKKKDDVRKQRNNNMDDRDDQDDADDGPATRRSGNAGDRDGGGGVKVIRPAPQPLTDDDSDDGDDDSDDGDDDD